MSPRHFRDNIENILKSPVTLFKKKSMKFYLFLEVESQVKAYQHSYISVS